MIEPEQLALAGLIHNLPALLQGTGTQISESAQNFLSLGRLDSPVQNQILDRAESHWLPAEGDKSIIADKPLISIFCRVYRRAPVRLQPRTGPFLFGLDAITGKSVPIKQICERIDIAIVKGTTNRSGFTPDSFKSLKCYP
jgi:hypothetical protein